MTPLARVDLDQTVDAILKVQLRSGCIPWFEGGHADPWDHVEAAMALDVGGLTSAAERAYRWLARVQRADGAWASAYHDGIVQDPALDANFCAYVAVGVWHHHLATGDIAFLEEMWPVVERAVGFALELQLPDGSIGWARDADYRAWPSALLTSSSCVRLSLECAMACGRELGVERPDWELSALALTDAVADEGPSFLPKHRFAMDWYYPVLAGILTGDRARQRLRGRWTEFVEPGRGVRCVAERPWVTTGETCELILALDRVGLRDEATDLFGWIQHLRHPDGSYWTGATFPDGTLWPLERPTWGSAVVVLASDALEGRTRTSGLFREDGPSIALPLSAGVVETP